MKWSKDQHRAVSDQGYLVGFRYDRKAGRWIYICWTPGTFNRADNQPTRQRIGEFYTPGEARAACENHLEEQHAKAS